MYSKELVKQAKNGNIDSMLLLAEAYYTGRGIDKNPEQAFFWTNKAYESDSENPAACNSLGMCYSDGFGVPADQKRALELFLKAAEKDYASAIHNLARAYRYGYGTEIDLIKARNYYEKAAAMGDTDALRELGIMYHNGEGMPKDYEKAIEYYNQLIEKNDAWGYALLANAYEDGLGVEKNTAKAFELWQKAASLGHTIAQYIVGLRYENGRDVTENKSQALIWYKQAAEAGHGDASLKVATMLIQNGEVEEGLMYLQKAADLENEDGLFLMGVWLIDNKSSDTASIEQALGYFEKGAKKGNVKCLIRLGDYYSKNPSSLENIDKAIYYYEKAEELGSVDAIIKLGLAYDENGFAGTNFVRAAQYYKKAAEAGSPAGETCLGMLYQDGKGIRTDQKKAFELFQSASSKGFPIAIRRLGLCYCNGIGTEKDTLKGIELLERANSMGDYASEQLLIQVYSNAGNEIDPGKALHFIQERAEQGNPEAEYRLYEAYSEGKGMTKDNEKGMEWCKRAADHNHPIAQAIMGFHELVFRNNPRSAVSYWEKASANGNLKAAQELALIYLEGAEGVPANKHRAIELLKGAANEGFAESQCSLGLCYIQGDGVGYDPLEAAKWFERAADQGNVDAQRNLGLMYRKGEGVPSDKGKAAALFEKAAEQGNAKAQVFLAEMLADGEGVPTDYNYAASLYQQVIDNKEELRDDDLYINAVYNLALIFTLKLNNYRKAFPLWKELAERENDIAQYNLGVCYYEGLGTSKDIETAYYWWRRASALGNEEARLRLKESTPSPQPVTPGNIPPQPKPKTTPIVVLLIVIITIVVLLAVFLLNKESTPTPINGSEIVDTSIEDYEQENEFDEDRDQEMSMLDGIASAISQNINDLCGAEIVIPIGNTMYGGDASNQASLHFKFTFGFNGNINLYGIYGEGRFYAERMETYIDKDEEYDSEVYDISDLLARTIDAVFGIDFYDIYSDIESAYLNGTEETNLRFPVPNKYDDDINLDVTLSRYEGGFYNAVCVEEYA